ncbi:hypothetical protein STENM327S_01969 [Streptomyces tendae]
MATKPTKPENAATPLSSRARPSGMAIAKSTGRNVTATRPGLAIQVKTRWKPSPFRPRQRSLGAAPAQVGLAWLLHDAANVVLIPGTADPGPWRRTSPSAGSSWTGRASPRSTPCPAARRTTAGSAERGAETWRAGPGRRRRRAGRSSRRRPGATGRRVPPPRWRSRGRDCAACAGRVTAEPSVCSGATAAGRRCARRSERPSLPGSPERDASGPDGSWPLSGRRPGRESACGTQGVDEGRAVPRPLRASLAAVERCTPRSTAVTASAESVRREPAS